MRFAPRLIALLPTIRRLSPIACVPLSCHRCVGDGGKPVAIPCGSSAFQISSAAALSSCWSVKGRRASIWRTHSCEPQQSSSAAAAFFSGRKLNQRGRLASRGGARNSPDAQAAYATIGINIEAKMGAGSVLAISLRKVWREFAAASIAGGAVRHVRSAPGSFASAESAASMEQLSGKFPLKCDVSTSTRRIVPGAPSLIDYPIVSRSRGGGAFPIHRACLCCARAAGD